MPCTITNCVHCGAEFFASNRRNIYCTGACRTAVYRERLGLKATALDVRAWEGTAIQRRRIDGYVNATSMCKAYGKLFADYRRLDRTTQYVQALSTSMGIPIDLLIQSITTGLNEQRGTWVHPRIAVDLARWLHPEFAVMMDGWFLESFTPKLPAAQGRTAQSRALAAKPTTRRRQVAKATGPTQITWGDRVTLVGIAWHARQIDAEISKILRTGVLSD